MKNRMRTAVAVLAAIALLFSGIYVPGQTQAAAKPKLNKKKVTLKVGKTVKLKLKHAKKVKWSSNNKKVATVNKKGKVKAKKAGKAKIVAKYKGKKYTCKVTVKKKGGKDSDSDDPSATATANPSASPTAAPGAVPNFSGTATTVSSQVVPTPAPDDTLAVGNLSVKLGSSKAEVETSTGGKADREEGTPLGFDSYIYNPSLDYTNYTQVQFDNDKVVCISTMSKYFCYEGLVTSGVDTKDSLTEKGFKSMKARYDYEAGYMYETDNEYVTAFVDHQGDGKVYAIEVYSKATSKYGDNTNLDLLAKAESGTYDATINANMAKELFDWACVFRVAKGLTPFAAYDSNAAQLHSEDMATNDFAGMNSSNGTGWRDRFDQAYLAPIYAAECYGARSLDAFGFITFLVDEISSEKNSYDKLTRTKDKDGFDIPTYYLCTGFATNSSTKDIAYAVLDMFHY